MVTICTRTCSMHRPGNWTLTGLTKYTINPTWNGQSIIFNLTPAWYHPSDEGTPCCRDALTNSPSPSYGSWMQPPTLKVEGYWDPKLSVSFPHGGSIKVVSVAWWTCVRNDSTAGVIPYAMDQWNDVSFSNSWFGMYITHCEIVILQCLNNIWTAGYWDIGTTTVHDTPAGWHFDPDPPVAKFQWSQPGAGGGFAK